jgi:O-glycosyl hydrolase
MPFIKRAQEVAKGNIRFLASPWSPPAWMKTNNNMLQGGKLKKEYSQTWADYFVKYVKAYEAAGIPIWGISVQNEAMATQVWESCIYTAIATAFINLDGKVAVVILNLKDTDQILQLWVEGKTVKFQSPAEAVITLIL